MSQKNNTGRIFSEHDVRDERDRLIAKTREFRSMMIRARKDDPESLKAIRLEYERLRARIRRLDEIAEILLGESPGQALLAELWKTSEWRTYDKARVLAWQATPNGRAALNKRKRMARRRKRIARLVERARQDFSLLPELEALLLAFLEEFYPADAQPERAHADALALIEQADEMPIAAE